MGHLVELTIATVSFTSQDSGNDAQDSDVNPATGFTGAIELNPGEYRETIDAGLVDVDTSLSGRAWRDSNADGLQDTGELSVDGVTVNLLSPGGSQLATTTTANGGLYNFPGLESGNYILKFIVPLAMNLSFTGYAHGNDPALDSDVNPNSGLTNSVFLLAGENNATIDAGLVNTTATVGDKVWKGNSAKVTARPSQGVVVAIV